MTSHTEPQIQQPQPFAAPPEPPRQGLGIASFLFLLIAATGVGAIIYFGIQNRVAAETRLVTHTEEMAVPVVKVIHPEMGDPVQEIVLPGNIQAFTDTPIYARTNGYLKAWHVDLGANVKQGQLLAEIETPEVDKQLQQARAELETSRASLALAQSTAERWQSLLKTNSVSRQETDEKVANWNVQKASYEAVASNVHRLEDLQSFQKVYAPYDGVITARNTDTGALIASGGASAANRELFHLSAIHRLRVFINVPQVYSSAARPGSVAELTLQEMPGRIFRGKLVRTANSIDPASRTLLTEIEVENPRGELLPGAYVSVHLKMAGSTRALMIPSNTLVFRQEGLRAAVVRDNTAHLVPITIGRDLGREVEVIAGLQTTDDVIADPPDSLTSGAKVQIDKAQPTEEKKAQ